MNRTGIRILCGLDHNEGRPTLNRIAKRRFEQIRPTLTMMGGDNCYDGPRCSPNNVADRFSGSWAGAGALRYAWTCFSTWMGWQDHKIVATWHERASAEYWYRYEKQWG